MYYMHIERTRMDDLTTLTYFDFTENFKKNPHGLCNKSVVNITSFR